MRQAGGADSGFSRPQKRPLRATCAPPGGGRLAIWLSARTRVCKGGNNVVLRRAALLHRAIGSRHGCRSASAPLRGAARHQRGARVRRWATLPPRAALLQQAKAAARGALHARRLVGRARRPRRGGGATPFAKQPGATCATRACKSGASRAARSQCPSLWRGYEKRIRSANFFVANMTLPCASDP